MKKIAVVLIGLVALGALALPAQADHRSHHRWHPHFGWYFVPPPYVVYSPPVYVDRRPIIIEREAPTVYVQPPAPQPQQQAYWYYCKEQGAYYPYIQACPGGWMTVVPQTQPPQ